MAARFGRGDLLAGSAASAALLLLGFVLGVTPSLAIPLAVATYAGVALLRPQRDRDAEIIDDAARHQLAYRAALANTAALRALQPRIANPAVRERVGRILDQAARILTVMREDGSLAAAPLFNDHVLVPFHALLTEYVRLSSRGVRSADGLLAKTETHDLPMIEQAVTSFYEQLHRPYVVDLAALGEVVELSLEGIAAMTPRRFTP